MVQPLQPINRGGDKPFSSVAPGSVTERKDSRRPQRNQPTATVDTGSFAEQVRSRLDKAGQDRPDSTQAKALNWSRHAHQRLNQGGHNLGSADQAAIAAAVDRVAAKGGQESLVLFDGLALVVNVPKRTVITAADAQRLQDGVFTQIDSAVIVAPPTDGEDQQTNQTITGAGPLMRKLPIPPTARRGMTDRRSI